MLYDGALYAGGLFETYNGITQHGLVKVATGSGSLITAFNAHLRADTGIGTYGAYDGEAVTLQHWVSPPPRWSSASAVTPRRTCRPTRLGS